MKDQSAPIVIESHTVPVLDEKIRLSDYAPSVINSLPSKKAIKTAIKKGLVTINGAQGYTGDFIYGGEVIVLLQDEEKKAVRAVKLDIEVCYEDDYLAVVNKPAGLLVSGNKHRTLENGLSSVLQKSTQLDALVRPEPIHRLDFPTSGALLIGKTRQAVILLNKIFEEREIIKKYKAVTIGKQDKSGCIITEVGGKEAKSKYEILNTAISERFECLNLLELTLFTGRRHQLRIHLSSIGNPILGDAEYGMEDKILKGKGLYLHSYSLEFIHPFTHDNLKVEVNPPKKFNKLFVSK